MRRFRSQVFISSVVCSLLMLLSLPSLVLAHSFAPPGAPQDVQAQPDQGHVMLTWTPVADAVSYNIYRGTSSHGEGSTPYNPYPIVTAHFTNTKVDQNTLYYYQITAVNTNGEESARSAEVSASPNPNLMAHPTPAPGVASIPPSSSIFDVGHLIFIFGILALAALIGGGISFLVRRARQAGPPERIPGVRNTRPIGDTGRGTAVNGDQFSQSRGPFSPRPWDDLNDDERGGLSFYEEPATGQAAPPRAVDPWADSGAFDDPRQRSSPWQASDGSQEDDRQHWQYPPSSSWPAQPPPPPNRPVDRNWGNPRPW